jgi:hypothetical protein
VSSVPNVTGHSPWTRPLVAEAVGTFGLEALVTGPIAGAALYQFLRTQPTREITP